MNIKKWILITGTSTGIGWATTEYLASKGFGIYAGARKQEDLAGIISDKIMDKIINKML